MYCIQNVYRSIIININVIFYIINYPIIKGLYYGYIINTLHILLFNNIE